MESGSKKFPFKDGEWILFQGDSITDCGRREIVKGEQSKLGSGYVKLIAAELARRAPGVKLEILNRAISGDRTTELLERWERDCLGLDADWLSLMAGVNDVWRSRMEWCGQTEVPLDAFSANYRLLLDKARTAGTKHFILMSPTTIDDDLDSDLNRILITYGDAVKKIAADFGAVYVPAREALHAAIRAHPGTRYTTDGCHPTDAGHAVLAQAWLEAVCR